MVSMFGVLFVDFKKHLSVNRDILERSSKLGSVARYVIECVTI